MTVSNEQKASTTGRTPSLSASLFVLGVMIGLILLSVILFGEHVAEGPLQVSMTLATLTALGVAYFYGFRGGVIGHAVEKSVSGTLGTIFVLLAIGAIIGTLYLTGTVAAFIYYGVAIISPQFYYITVFIIASALSIMLGSSLTTVAAVGVPFVGLATAMGVSPAITAGAALSGAILGDKVAKISDTVVLTIASVGGVTAEEQSRTVMRTAMPTVIIAAILFLVLGIIKAPTGSQLDPAQVQTIISGQFNVSLVAFLPVILIFVLSGLRLSGFLALMLPALVAVILAAFTQPELIARLAANPELPYWEAVFKVGIDTLANGFHLASGIPELDKIFSGGGTAGMLTTIWLILVAAAFGAVADYTGMLRQVISPILSLTKGAASLLLVTILTSLGLNVVAADPYISIVLTARMFRAEYIKNRLKPVALSASIADSGTIASYIIPWNVHGALVAGTLGMGVVMFAPYTFLAYLSPLVTLVIGAIYFRKDKLAKQENAQEVYGKEPDSLPIPEQMA